VRARLYVVTQWDLRILGRALALASLAFVVAWLVTAATDEGGIGWGVRAGRTLPIAPVCAALGTVIALAPARGRGEVRALAALGRAPWQNAAGSVIGGAFAAMFAAGLIAASPSVDVSGFYPVASAAVDYRFEDNGFVDHAAGWRIESDGSLTKVEAAPPANEGSIHGPPRYGRIAAAASTALAGFALPLIAAHVLLMRPVSGQRRRLFAKGSSARALGAIGFTVVATVVLFHGAAARRVPALLAALPFALLLAAAVVRYRAPALEGRGHD
jgi:hypothetical protein